MMDMSTIQSNSSFTSLGKIQVRDHSNVMIAQKKIYNLLLNLSYGAYKATLMATLFSELAKHLIKQEKNLQIQLGIQTTETPQFIIQFQLKTQPDLGEINGLNTAFDYVDFQKSNEQDNCIELGKKLIDHHIISNNEFVEETIRAIELRSQEELYEELQVSNNGLNETLKNFEEVNEELEAFSYSVSHDLRAPLRHMVGFTELLNKHIGDCDEKTERFLSKILESSKRMGQLIDDLLGFSRTRRAAMELRTLNIEGIVNAVISELTANIESERINWTIHDLPVAVGDQTLIRLVFQNLISNAIKYSSKTEASIIEVGSYSESEAENVYFVKDNGAGFDGAPRGPSARRA